MWVFPEPDDDLADSVVCGARRSVEHGACMVCLEDLDGAGRGRKVVLERREERRPS